MVEPAGKELEGSMARLTYLALAGLGIYIGRHVVRALVREWRYERGVEREAGLRRHPVSLLSDQGVER